jgi:hypothetical protein
VRSEMSCRLAEERIGDSLVGKGVGRRRLGPLEKDDICLAESEKREGRDPGAKASAWRGTKTKKMKTNKDILCLLLSLADDDDDDYGLLPWPCMYRDLPMTRSRRQSGLFSQLCLIPSPYLAPKSCSRALFLEGRMGGGQSKARAQSLEQEVARLKQELSDAKHASPRPTDRDRVPEAEAARLASQDGEKRDTPKRMESAGDMILKVFYTLAQDSATCDSRDCTVDFGPSFETCAEGPCFISLAQDFLPFSALPVCPGPMTVVCSILCSWPRTALGKT